MKKTIQKIKSNLSFKFKEGDDMKENQLESINYSNYNIFVCSFLNISVSSLLLLYIKDM